jgi:hypothetical protein
MGCIGSTCLGRAMVMRIRVAANLWGKVVCCFWRIGGVDIFVNEMKAGMFREFAAGVYSARLMSFGVVRRSIRRR